MAKLKYPKSKDASDAVIKESLTTESNETPELDGDELILKNSLDGLKAQIEEELEERALMLDDLKFCTLDQWPAKLRAEREGDVNGPRPCLTIDKLNQYITQVVNDMRQNKPAGQARPVDDKGDPEVAKIFQGLIRHVEDRSTASIAFSTAGESAARIGLGFFRITTDYVSHDSFDQEALIQRIPNTFSVYLGPHIKPDGSDAESGWIFKKMPKAEFEREFPGKKTKAEEFDIDPEALSFWLDDEGVVICEYFYTHYEKEELLHLSDGTITTKKKYEAAVGPQSADEDAGLEMRGLPWYESPPRTTITDTRDTFTKTIKWCKHTGAEVLDKRDWAGKYIPIVEVVGNEAVISGKRKLWGLTRPAKDALRAYNYWISALTEKMALAPKAPYIAAIGQLEGREQEWANANRENRAVIQYNPIDVNGSVVPAPQRQQPMQMESAMTQMLLMMENNVKSALGMYKASVGDSDSQQSGRAILALQGESDTGTYHFGANLALSVQHCARILVDLFPKIMDKKRVARIIGEDGKVGMVELNPEQKESIRKTMDSSGAIRKIYNLNVGTYDVTVTTGPSYNTKRMEAAAVFTELAQGAGDPGSAAVMRYLTVKNSDFTSSREATDMLFALLPPQAQAVNQQDGEEPIPPQAMQQIAEMTQALEQMQQQGQQLQQENQELKSGAQIQTLKVQADAQAKSQALEVEKAVQAEKLDLEKAVQTEKQRLARDQFEFEKQLEIEKSDHAIDLAERKAVAEHSLKRDELAFQQQCKAEENAVNFSTIADQAVLDEKLVRANFALDVAKAENVQASVAV